MTTETPQLLVADKKGKVYPVPGLEAVGMKAGHFFRLRPDDLVKLPPASQLFLLPDRSAVGYDRRGDGFATLRSFFAVAAFTPPGYTMSYSTAYREIGRPRILPLFAYGAAAFFKGEFYAACVRVDKDARHDRCLIDMGEVKRNAARFGRMFPKNRLIEHLERCAISYGCPNAQNLFLQRYEAPLPASPHCNASCRGCISYQPKDSCPPTQPRIRFVPSPEEIRDVALFHIRNVRDPVVSFGQGCEGEPLLEADTIERAIRLIRKETDKGTININTNASRPGLVGRLFDAGLDNIRVSMNSVREEYYAPYYKPRDYTFKDVLRSITVAKKKRGFVSVNYLTMPGFTDSKGEIKALRSFIAKYRIDMIQWRNLNFDPARYFEDLRFQVAKPDMVGIKEAIGSLKKRFPRLTSGYFNPRLP